jgi:RNA polymerase sigma factor (sigma-70 family)
MSAAGVRRSAPHERTKAGRARHRLGRVRVCSVMKPATMGLTADDISALYARYAEDLAGYFVRRTLQAEVAVELVGETFARAFVQRARFRGGGEREAIAWVYGIARTQLADYFRRGQVHRRALARLGVATAEPVDADFERIEELAALGDLRAQVAERLTQLSVDHRDALLLRIVEERDYPDVASTLGVSEQVARARVSRGLRALRRGLALLAVLAVCVAVFLALDLAGRSGPLSEQVPLADALQRAAQAALAAPSLMPRDDQYYYVRSQGTQLEGGAGGVIALLTQTTSRWTSADRPSIVQGTVSSIRYPSARDRHALAGSQRQPFAGGAPVQLPARGGYQVGYQLLTRAQVLRYPTSPRAIYRRLNGANHGATRSEAADEIFDEIGETLSSSPLPAALRSGFYRALALVPGLRLTANVRDARGRIGVGAAIVRAGVEEQLIFDPATAEMLGERKIVLDPARADLAAKRGMVVNDITYSGWAVTDSAPRGVPITSDGSTVVCTGQRHGCRTTHAT